MQDQLCVWETETDSVKEVKLRLAPVDTAMWCNLELIWAWIRQRETCKEVLSGLFIQEGSGTQARTIEGKTENETQVKNMGQKKSGKTGRGIQKTNPKTTDNNFY